MCVTEQLTVAIDFNSTEKNTMEVNGYKKLFGCQHSSNYLLLCSTEDRNSYRFGNNMRVVNDDTFSFWVNYPFKVGMKSKMDFIYFTYRT